MNRNYSFKKYLLLLTFALGISFVFGQEYQSGFIINLDGSKSNGFIVLDNSFNQFFGCNFNESEFNPPKLHPPDAILGYGYENGPTYKKRKVNFRETLTEVLLKTEFEGALSLYSFYGRFFIEKGADISEFETGSSSTSKNNLLFTGLMSDCKSSLKKMGPRFLNEFYYIKKLVLSYDKCDTEI